MRIFYKDLPLAVLKSSYGNEHSRYQNICGMEVHYRDEGEGQPLVLIHGTGSSLHTWDEWVARLRDRYRIIRLDMPGFGLTGPHPGRTYDMDAYCTFLKAFVDHLGLPSFHLAGNSLGGRIAWNFALRFPAAVRHLVLIAASGYPANVGLLVFRIAKLPGGKLFLRRAAPFGGVALNLKQCFVDQKKVTGHMVKRYHQMLLREGNRQALIDRIDQEFSDDYHDIPQIASPTLIMWGDQDRVVPPAFAFRFQSDLPAAQLIVYPNVGHIPMEEIPDRSANDVATFLSDTSAS